MCSVSQKNSSLRNEPEDSNVEANLNWNGIHNDRVRAITEHTVISLMSDFRKKFGWE